MYIFYSLALALALVLASPWWLIQMARHGKYRAGLRERLGGVPARLARPAAGTPSVRTVWLHAVSVGEVLAVSRLVEDLRRDFDAVYISTTTLTGQKVARETPMGSRKAMSGTMLPTISADSTARTPSLRCNHGTSGTIAAG